MALRLIPTKWRVCDCFCGFQLSLISFDQTSRNFRYVFSENFEARTRRAVWARDAWVSDPNSGSTFASFLGHLVSCTAPTPIAL